MTEGRVNPLEETPRRASPAVAPSSIGFAVRPWWLALTVILIVAALLRLPALDRIPPGFQFDEAYNAIDAWRVVQGSRDLFFPSNGGREPLLSYWQAIWLALWGPELAVLRLGSVIIGLLTLVTVALTLPRLFAGQANAAGLGLLAAGVLAVTYWHVHFSRYSIRAILVPLAMTLVFGAFYQGTRPHPLHLRPLVLAGVALAASVYAHPTGRLLPLALAVYTVWLIWTDRRQARGYLLSLALVGGVSFILFIPLGLYFLNHQWLFWGHPSDVFAVDTSGGAASVARSLLDQTLAVLGMVFVRGDQSNFHNLPFRPTFDPLLAVCFGLGLLGLLRDAWRARGLDRAPYTLLLIWSGIAIAPTLLSDAAPNFSRAIGVLPVLALVAAFGIQRLTASVTSYGIRLAPYALAALILGVCGLWTAYDYFIVWARQPELYYSYDADKEDAAHWVQTWQTSGRVYLAPLWATQSTIAFLTRDHPPQAIEMDRGLILPAADGRDVHYTYPFEQERRLRRLGGWLGEAAERQVIQDRLGQPLLTHYRLPSLNRHQVDGLLIHWGQVRPEETRQDRFEGAPWLVGVSGDTQLSPGDRAQFLLYWRTPLPLPQSLTLFAHLVDATGQTVLQDDHQPLDTSYPTTRWATDEVILDQIEFNLPDTLPLGTYRLVVGWYDLTTQQRRPLVAGGTELIVRDLVIATERK